MTKESGMAVCALLGGAIDLLISRVIISGPSESEFRSNNGNDFVYDSGRGYGSGGHNKTHKQLENFRRIDSFAFYDYLMADKYLYCKTNVQYSLNRGDIIYYVQSRTALIKVLSIQSKEYMYVELSLSRVPGIDGKSVKMCFHCRIVDAGQDTYMISANITHAANVQN